MPSKNKRRGNEFERELVRKAEARGLVAQRAYASDGLSLGEASSVDVKVSGMRLQAKRRKKLAKYLAVPGGCDGVAFKQDRAKPLVLITYDTLLTFLEDCGW
jgi:Holliday junction resolvase